MNQVLKAMHKTALTDNGAISYVGTGNELLDYFQKAGTFKGRTQDLVNKDMSSIFSTDPLNALKLLFATRLITRKPTLEDDTIDELQTGYGRRDEFYKGLVWLHNNRKDILYKNLHLVPLFGSWKDLFSEELLAILDQDKIVELVKENLDDDLLLKYLPNINRPSNKVRKDKKFTNRAKMRLAFAKKVAKNLGLTEKAYRKMKAGGNAHIFQKQICNKKWNSIKFNGIPGKALFKFLNSKGKDGKSIFERHGLTDKLIDWANKQTNVKFTGYPYDLTRACSKNPSTYQKLVLDKQFQSVLDQMKDHGLGNVLCALDTSASMTWVSHGQGKVTPYEICLSMGLVFSGLNVGYFKDYVVAFSNTSQLNKITGSDLYERYNSIQMCGGIGGTNFQSVIDLLVQIRQHNPNIPLSDYPETLLVVSDMQFNPVGGNTQTNYEAAMQKLQSVGLSDMRIIWWNVSTLGTDFPGMLDNKGIYMISGFDPTNLKALMGLTKNKPNFDAKEKIKEDPMDGLNNFLSQPIFNLLTV